MQYIQDFWYMLMRRHHDFSVLWRATRFINNADIRADESYQLLLNKYPAITSVTCELRVDPSSLIPYARSSRVTRERGPNKSNRKRV